MVRMKNPDGLVRGLALAAVFCVLAATTGAAQAADINDRSGVYDRGPYDDPRYADLYGRDDDVRHRRDAYRNQHDRYGPRYGDYGERPAYRGDEADERYVRRRDVPRDYGRDHEWQRRDHIMRGDGYGDDEWARRGCVPRFKLVMGLVRLGWQDFNPVHRSRHYASVRAYHPEYGHAELTIERCSGHIVSQRPIYAEQRFDHYRSRRYGRYGD